MSLHEQSVQSRAEGQTETLPEQGNAVGLTNHAVARPGATMGTSSGVLAAAFASPVGLHLRWHTSDENEPTPVYTQTQTFLQALALVKATDSRVHTPPHRAIHTHVQIHTCMCFPHVYPDIGPHTCTPLLHVG